MTAALLGIFLALASPVSFAQDDILGELEKKKEGINTVGSVLRTR